MFVTHKLMVNTWNWTVKAKSTHSSNKNSTFLQGLQRFMSRLLVQINIFNHRQGMPPIRGQPKSSLLKWNAVYPHCLAMCFQVLQLLCKKKSSLQMCCLPAYHMKHVIKPFLHIAKNVPDLHFTTLLLFFYKYMST